MIRIPFKIEEETIHDLAVTWLLSDQFVTNSIVVTVNAGSLYETEEYLPDAKAGIFHFLEHQAFQLQSGKDAMELLNTYSSNVNALTSREKTCYYAQFVQPDPEILKILLQMVFQKKAFSKSKVEKEKKIILNEILASLDDPLYTTFESWNKLVYQHYPAWRLPIGTKESIEKITPENLQHAYDQFYHPKQSDLIILTNLSKSFWLPAFQILPELDINPVFSKKKLTIPPDPDTQSGKVVQFGRINFPIPYWMAGWKPLRQSFSYKDGLIGEMISAILFGSTTRFQDALYEKSLVDDSFSLDWDWDACFGCWYMSGFSRQPEKVVEIVEKEMRRRQKIGIRKNEFQMYKQYSLVNSVIEAYHPKELIFQVQTLRRFGVRDWKEYTLLIQSITWEDINENLVRFMPESQFKVFISLPETDNVSVPEAKF
jgi:predicted Zn-dependent peptidase